MRNVAGLFFCLWAIFPALCALPARGEASAHEFTAMRSPSLLQLASDSRRDRDEDEEEGDEVPPYPAPEYIRPDAAYPLPEWLPPPGPANCGEFRYWNGEVCADARVRPPYVGPRW
jgi:hypothetical protein